MGGVPPMGAAPGGLSPQGMGMMGVLQSGMPMSDFEKMSPMDIVGIAQEYANQVVMAGPGRRSLLAELRKQLPEALMSAVTEQVRVLDEQAKQQGKQMIQNGAMPM